MATTTDHLPKTSISNDASFQSNRYTLRHSLCHYIICRRSFLAEKFLAQFGISNFDVYESGCYFS